MNLHEHMQSLWENPTENFRDQKIYCFVNFDKASMGLLAMNCVTTIGSF